MARANVQTVSRYELDGIVVVDSDLEETKEEEDQYLPVETLMDEAGTRRRDGAVRAESKPAQVELDLLDTPAQSGERGVLTLQRSRSPESASARSVPRRDQQS